MPIIIAIILVGALICVGIITLTNFQNTTYVSASVVSANESLARATTSGITLATGAASRNGVCGALTNVLNGTTGNVAIGLGNFSQTGCIVTNTTSTVDWSEYAATLRYTYPYTYDNASVTTNAIGSVNTSIIGLATTWLPIIIVVIAAGIVLAILLGAFGRKRQ